MMLDTRSLEPRWLPLPTDARIMVCNTMVKHRLASAEYNARRADCEDAARRLGVTFLCELAADDVPRLATLPARLARRGQDTAKGYV